MTLKLKIALYNTLLVGGIMSLVLLFMASISHSVIATSTVNQLKEIVSENADEVEWDNGVLELDDIDFYKNHVTTLVYSTEHTLVAGSFSGASSITTPLLHNEISTVTLDGVEYYLYDYYTEHRKYGGIYLRGIVSVSDVENTVNLLFYLTILAFPVFLLLAGFGSYCFVKKAMNPLDRIINTASEISDGSDLSERIALGEGKSELHTLAATFDRMFSQLEEAFISERQFSSDVSHELRTPTAVILAECECNLTSTATEEDKTQALTTIERQGKKMLQLIQGLLRLNRLDNGVERIQTETIDFSELVSIVCEEQASLLPERHTLNTDIPPNIKCIADPTMMIRVVSNLIDNAVKYGIEEGQVTVCLTQTDNNVLLSVKDDGIGMESQHLSHIFNRLYQVDRSRNSQSMGLGLAMVAQIIKLHNGTIDVTSTLHEGSCFTVTLPKGTLI